MINRRDFLKGGLAFGPALGMAGMLPAVIARAYAITPDPGTTYLDAEHVVILMQENRSFDHMFGTLRGVRGFNDPRALRQSDGTSIFFQRGRDGKAFGPWHASIQDTRSTWMGALAHLRHDQVDAWNGGAQNNWIEAKRYGAGYGRAEYSHIPGTMAYYTREDLPFYYALADAFTVCDQNYCSTMTSTAPNRLMLWTGTVREDRDFGSLIYLRNEQTRTGALAWPTYPERLQQAGVSWRCYQNQLWCESEFPPEIDGWLSNFNDNVLEHFERYPIHYSPRYHRLVQDIIDRSQAALAKRQADLRQALAQAAPGSAETRRIETLLRAYARHAELLETKRTWGQGPLADLSPEQRELRSRGLQINSADPDFEQLATFAAELDGKMENISAPKGDILYQFRKDVREGRLPTVSYLVAPGNFSAHPSAPWYGAWYVSEVMKILTENPEVWKKTIFIVNYDENDGFFDHAPSFVAADPQRRETGTASAGIDVGREYCSAEEERLQGVAEEYVRAGPIGLGYRVPMIIASPWSRGGWVNSEVSDHTSILRFLETFIEKKYGKIVTETNISAWRRTICGNLVSNFRPFEDTRVPVPALNRDEYIAAITRARNKPLPSGFTALNDAQLTALRGDPAKRREILWQERGTRPACAIPYELYVDGEFDTADERSLLLRMEASARLFGAHAAGGPFNVYLYGVAAGCQVHPVGGVADTMAAATYVVRPGDTLLERIELSRFTSGRYDIAVHGPNGFYRHFLGSKQARSIRIACGYERDPGHPSGFRVVLSVQNLSDRSAEVVVRGRSYDSDRKVIKLATHERRTVPLEIARHHHWYDFSVASAGGDFEWRYAGHVETGKASVTDPAMAGEA